MIMNVLVNNTMSRAAETNNTPTCSFVLAKCDQALKDAKKQVEIRDKVITDSQLLIQKQADVITTDEAKLDAWYRSPVFLVMLGILGGFAASQKLGK